MEAFCHETVQILQTLWMLKGSRNSIQIVCEKFWECFTCLMSIVWTVFQKRKLRASPIKLDWETQLATESDQMLDPCLTTSRKDMNRKFFFQNFCCRNVSEGLKLLTWRQRFQFCHDKSRVVLKCLLIFQTGLLFQGHQDWTFLTDQWICFTKKMKGNHSGQLWKKRGQSGLPNRQLLETETRHWSIALKMH